MPPKDNTRAAWREALKQFASSDIAREMKRNAEAIASNPEMQRILQTGKLIREYQEQQAERSKQKRTRPPIKIPHLAEAIDQLLREQAQNPPSKKSPKRDAGRVIAILKEKFKVTIPDNQEKTIQRRIATVQKGRRQV